ncbi:MAG: hypothetical protein WAR23_08745, partial [Dethiobacteria bacterium]
CNYYTFTTRSGQIEHTGHGLAQAPGMTRFSPKAININTMAICMNETFYGFSFWHYGQVPWEVSFAWTAFAGAYTYLPYSFV